MIYEYEDYRQFLKGWLSAKIARNSRYSLRGMAQQLGVNPTYLSQVIRKKRNLSLQMAERIVSPLGLQGSEKNYFFCLVQAENAPSLEIKDSYLRQASSLSPKGPIQRLDIDAFKAISQWHHIALLEMSELTHFKWSIPMIAKELKLHPYEVTEAIERLLRLNLLKQTSPGIYKKTYSAGVFASDKANEALRGFHRQLMEKAIDSLPKSNTEKYVGSQTIAVDPSQMEQAKQIIREFKSKMSVLFEKSSQKTKVYTLLINFFELK